MRERRPDPRRLAVGFALVVLLAPVVCHAAFVAAPSTGSFVVVSGSMGDAVPAGSVVYVYETGDYDPGDVITMRRGDGYVTHRVVAETDAGYATKGDANDAVDDRRATDADVVGELLFVVPVYGHLLAAASSAAGYVLLVLLPGTALIALELRRAARALDD